MKLSPAQTDEKSLSGFGEEARGLLMQRDYAGLARRFGYALTFDRLPAAAIEADFLNAAASPRSLRSDDSWATVVKYFASNDAGLFAVVECTVPVAPGAAVLLELVITGSGEEKHITVEDISGVSV